MLETFIKTDIIPAAKAESLLATTGVALIKPDAVELGITEELLAFMSDKIHQAEAGEIRGVYPVQLTPSNVAKLYPNLHPSFYPQTEKYMVQGPSVLAVFRGNGENNLTSLVKSIKGRRPSDWSKSEIQHSPGLEFGIRCIIPVPGTGKEYAAIKERLIKKTVNPQERFSDEEFSIYVKNLIHSPDDFQEITGLMSLLSQDQLKENFSGKEIGLIKLGHMIYG